MSTRVLRQKPRINYYEPELPGFDEYIYCDGCRDMVYEYCSIHGPLLAVPDDKIDPTRRRELPSFVPNAALTIPRMFLHLAWSNIPGGGVGVYSTLTLPRGVRFGPYRGVRMETAASNYCWQIYTGEGKPSHLVDAVDGNKSNWMRYVNCSRHSSEQNLVAYQYRGRLYYRTTKIIPRYTELLVYYGNEFADLLGIDVEGYNYRAVYVRPPGAPSFKKRKVETKEDDKQTEEKTDQIRQFAENRISCKTFDAKENNISCKNIDVKEKNVSCKDIDVKENNVSCRNIFVKENNVSCKNIDTENNNVSCKNIETEENNVPCKNSTAENKFSCNFCKYKSKQKNNLTRHLRTHTGEKPFSCDICNYKCNQKGTLTVHLRTHTGEKPFTCDICNYKCNQKGNLTVHLRTHTGEKPYSCEFCNYACKEKGSLTVHLRTHTGEKPYSCDICNYKCTQNHALKTHLIKVHLRK